MPSPKNAAAADEWPPDATGVVAARRRDHLESWDAEAVA